MDLPPELPSATKIAIASPLLTLPPERRCPGSWEQSGRPGVTGTRKAQSILTLSLYATRVLLRMVVAATPDFKRLRASFGYDGLRSEQGRSAAGAFWITQLALRLPVCWATVPAMGTPQQPKPPIFVLVGPGAPLYPGFWRVYGVRLDPQTKWASASPSSQADLPVSINLNPEVLGRYLNYNHVAPEQRALMEADLLEIIVHETTHLFQGIPPTRTQANAYKCEPEQGYEQYLAHPPEIIAQAAGMAAYHIARFGPASSMDLKAYISRSDTPYDYYFNISGDPTYQQAHPEARRTHRRFIRMYWAYRQAFSLVWDPSETAATWNIR